METSEKITQALREKGLTKRSWARKIRKNEETVLSYFKLYTDAIKEPKGKILKEIEATFKADFGFSIRNELEKIEHEND